MSNQTQAWLRAELIAAPESTFGPQLMIPADGLEFHETQLVFHHQGEVVYVAEQGQLRSVTWCTKLPNPEFERRKAQWPKHGTRWTDEEREDLKHRLTAAQSWSTISKAHGRSKSGVQQEAVKQGWVFPDTHNPTPELLAARLLAADPAHTASAPSNADEPSTPSTDASPAAGSYGSPTDAADGPPTASNTPQLAGSGASIDASPTDDSDAPPATAPQLAGRPSYTASPPQTTGSAASPAAAFTGESPSAAPTDLAPVPAADDHGPAPATGDTAPTPDSAATATVPAPRTEPTPGLLARAQSSLARATLGAYINVAKPPPTMDASAAGP